ncbi:hypothetical protein AMS68_005794 [Peltaster fructicola]|uniref:GST N-terminal domain-containing protein n=1 Tax=Peltaster fructicola TaxID=286661 RepID=A0A6H0XZU7_9PEZI|nr:hypothetical protein AMS68_005794 [Peltaster fructicola]
MLLNYKKIPYETIFLEFPDIEPTLKELGVSPVEPTTKYTVPAILHVSTDKAIMDSQPIAHFLEATYSDPPLALTSELGDMIQTDGRRLVGRVLSASVMPREINILSARSQEYFRRTRETSIGHPLEDLLQGDREVKSWLEMEDGARTVGNLLLTNKADGPFVLGSKVSYADFFIAGALQCARVVDETIFQRMIAYPGYKQIYDACQPYMEKKD